MWGDPVYNCWKCGEKIEAAFFVLLCEGCLKAALEEAKKVKVGAPRLTPAAIQAISQVILVNDDICRLLEKRGVTREEMVAVFRLAELGHCFQEPDHVE